MKKDNAMQNEKVKRTQRTKFIKCQHCGTELSRLQINRRNAYCSRRCFCNAHYGEIDGVGGIETHSDKLLKAIELYLSGKTQSEAAKTVGLHSSVVSNRVRKYDIAILPDHVCEYCGETFARKSRSNLPKFCSDECKKKAKLAIHLATYEYKRRRFDPYMRAEAVELYSEGHRQTAIARRFGIPVGTVCGWIHNFGSSVEPKRTPEALARLPLSVLMSEAADINEWAQILREIANCADTSTLDTVRIVCGAVYGNCETYHLVAVVMDKLRMNPYSGERFAFCDIMRNTVTTIQWQNGVLLLTKAFKQHGRYVWPSEKLGASVVVASAELDYIIFRHEIDENDKKT